MADRFPLILNTSANQIQEIGSGDQLDLSGNNIANAGIITAGNVTIGAATTDLIVNGDARVTGILTVGTGSLTLDGPNNLVNVGTALTLGHTQGLQFHTQNLHSEGFEINQINLSGIATFNEARLGNMKRLKFGDDIDLQIYHFSAGSGGNYISAANNMGIVVSAQKVEIMNQNHSAYYFKGEAAGSIVYHNNTARVTTTSTGINVTGNNVVSGNVTAVDGTFSGNVSIGGTLTYEDVTNIDSIGIITARNGIDCNGDIDVDGHTNLDNLSVAGVSTFSGDVTIAVGTGGIFTLQGSGPSIELVDANANDDFRIHVNHGIFQIEDATNANADRLKIDSSGVVTIPGNTDFGAGIDVTGTITATGEIRSQDDIRIQSTYPRLYLTDTDSNDDFSLINNNGSFLIYNDTQNAFRLKIDGSTGQCAMTLRPTSDSNFDLGTNTLRWQNLFVDDITVTGVVTATSFVGSGANLTALNIITDTSPQLGGNLDCNNKVVTLNDSTGAGNNRLKIGNAGDLQLFHMSNANYVSGEVDGKDLYVRSRRDLHLVCGNNASGYRNVIYADNNGTTRMYHPASGAVRLNTTTTGISVSGNVVATGNMSINDNNYLYLGNSGDFSLRFHNGTGAKIESGGNNMYIRSNLIELGDNSGNKYIKCIDAGAVELYHGVNAKKLETTSVGTKVTGVIETVSTPNADPYAGFIARSSGANNHCGFFADAAGGANAQAHIRFGYSGNVTWQWRVPFHAEGTSAGIWLYDYSINDDVIKISQGGNQSIRGHMYPRSNNTYDLGSSSLRWRNIYTNDLNLSNEGGANEVDGTWGNYTIQEGESDLFLINKRNGKKYKFNLTEVS